MYLPCDDLRDRHQLYECITSFTQTLKRGTPFYLFIDEVTYLPRWELSIKALIDEGSLSSATVVITGSDQVLLQEAASGFPGINRRGKDAKDFWLKPLNFREFATLVSPDTSIVDPIGDEAINSLEALFFDFLHCGGFLSAINDYMPNKSISNAVYSVYQDWIISDFVRKGKDRRKLVDLLSALYKRMPSQLSFNKIAQESGSLSTDTVIDYIGHLERLGVLTVLQAFNQNTLSAFPKKAKKLHLIDPMLYGVIHHLLTKEHLLSEKEVLDESHKVESVVVSHFLDSYPVYYLKADGEIDLVVVKQGKFFPIEVKWTNRTHPRDLKQISRYDNGLLLRKETAPGTVEGTVARCVFLELLRDPEEVLKLGDQR